MRIVRFIIGAALLGFLSTPTTASPINYVLTDAVAPPDDVTGSFTFDASDGATGTQSNVMITVTGTEFAGTYTALAATAAFNTRTITAVDSSTLVTVQVVFQDALDVNPDPLSSSGLGFTGEFPGTSYDFTSGDAVIATNTTPLPPALPLFAAGLAGFGLFARRRRKQVTA